MKPWQALGFAGVGVVATLIFFGRKKRAIYVRDPWRLHFKVDDDRRAQVVLSTLEAFGRSTELELFDGSNLFVLWMPGEWYEEGSTEPVENIFNRLDGAPGIKFVGADEQRGKGERETLNSGDPGAPSLADPDGSDFRSWNN